VAVFLLFFCTPGSQVARGGGLADVEDDGHVASLLVSDGVPGQLLAARLSR
jgi:hypothetical protein